MYTSENQKASSLFKLTILKWNFYRCFCLFQRFQPFLKEKNRRKSNLRNFWNARKKLGNFSKRPNRFNFFWLFDFMRILFRVIWNENVLKKNVHMKNVMKLLIRKIPQETVLKILKIPIWNHQNNSWEFDFLQKKSFITQKKFNFDIKCVRCKISKKLAPDTGKTEICVFHLIFVLEP